MKQPDTSALRERLAGYTSEQDIQELDGLTEKISGQINGLHNLLDEIKDLREEMHGIHESLRHTFQRERTAFNALTAAKDSAENIVDGISNAIVKAEQHTVIKAEVSTAELVNVILLMSSLLYVNNITTIHPCKRNRIGTKSVF